MFSRFNDDGSMMLSFLAEPRSVRESCLTAETETKVKATGEVAGLDAAVASHTGGVAVASQMNLYRCDH